MLRKNPDKGGSWGIMGGTFDPIHYGHLTLAECARETFHLDGILFTVSWNPPHRREKPKALFDDRLNIVKLAVGSNEFFAETDLEKELDGPGFTLSVIDLLKIRYPDVIWHLILGADNMETFDTWHKPEMLIKKVKVVVGNRPGYDNVLSDSPWAEAISNFNMPFLEISSTMIRQNIKDGKSIRYLLPENVRRFIYDRGLYR